MTGRWTWTAGLVVAVAAAAATAHGSYGVARAADVPAEIALLYPAITDGLALVAYATTTRLATSGRRYAWAIVILAAGVSGLAQAIWLAGGVHTVPGAVRFGIGAWPAVAAAVVAHLLFLLATADHATATEQASEPAVQNAPPVQPSVQPTAALNAVHATAVDVPASEPPAGPKDRARAAAQAHRDRHAALPTVTQLVDAAGVARGTAAAALRELRTEPTARTQP
ncbi:MAG: hypothetical protein ACT4QF_05040 [Sporichthyaceae bacterium]